VCAQTHHVCTIKSQRSIQRGSNHYGSAKEAIHDVSDISLVPYSVFSTIQHSIKERNRLIFTDMYVSGKHNWLRRTGVNSFS